MGEVEAVLTFGISGWPVWVHHARRDQHWRVLEIVEPRAGRATPAGTDRYILRVEGPLAYLPDREGRSYIAARRYGGLWLIEPDASAYPRRGTPPGE
jgi:hypothetical protein